MFKKSALNALYTEHRHTFKMAAAVGSALNKRFYGLQDAIDCLLIAAISGEAMVMIGPPGTAKSRLVRSFCNLLDLIPDDTLEAEGGNGNHNRLESQQTEGEHQTDDQSSTVLPGKRRVLWSRQTEAKRRRNDAYFEYLLTQFTEPSELFGFIDIPKLQNGTFERMDKGMMQKAQVVFLDEVFNASSAILNQLLAFMNERRFHDRGKSIPTPLRLLVSATNHPPREAGLDAVYDRFLLRCHMKNVARVGVRQDELSQLLDSAWRETHAPQTESKLGKWSGLLDAFASYRADVDRRTREGSLRIDPVHGTIPALTQLVSSLVKLRLSEMSNRRLVKMSDLILAMRLLRAAREDDSEIDIEQSDLHVLIKYSLDRDDPSAVNRLFQDLEIPK